MSIQNIAYILTPVEFGGAEQVNLNFLKHVDRNSFNISLIILHRPWEKDPLFVTALTESNYTIYKIPVAKKPPSKGKDFLRVLRCFTSVLFLLKSGRFDLIHTHGYFADIISIPAAKILGIPILSTCHGFISNNTKLRTYNFLDRRVLRFANKIIAVSEKIKADLVQNKIQISKIEVILNAVDLIKQPEQLIASRMDIRRSININDNELVVGYIGRLSEEKGIISLIKAGLLLMMSDVPVKILLIGEGNQRKELEEIVNTYGMTSHVIFTGFQNNIEHWLPALDILCLPSFMEGTPMSLLEAMAYGIPVIATAVGGIPDVIQTGINGILVSPNRPDELKEAIINLYRDKSARYSMAKAGQRTITRYFNIVDWTKRIENQYIQLLQSTRSKRKHSKWASA